ncbi:MAG: hypothetical protein U5L03_04150 [Burkholderiaceae bacterium]|nr:hypothetical protein [Burkholderiaceae bacterium]
MLVTRYCSAASGPAPGCRGIRSLLTIAMTLALNRPDELRLHLPAARNDDLADEDRGGAAPPPCCGVPAGVSAFRLAANLADRTPQSATGGAASTAAPRQVQGRRPLLPPGIAPLAARIRPMPITSRQYADTLVAAVSGGSSMSTRTLSEPGAGCRCSAGAGRQPGPGARLLRGRLHQGQAAACALLVIAATRRSAAGELIVAGLYSVVEEVFAISRFDRVLTIAPDVEAALAWCSAKAVAAYGRRRRERRPASGPRAARCRWR